MKHEFILKLQTADFNFFNSYLMTKKYFCFAEIETWLFNKNYRVQNSMKTELTYLDLRIGKSFLGKKVERLVFVWFIDSKGRSAHLWRFYALRDHKFLFTFLCTFLRYFLQTVILYQVFRLNKNDLHAVVRFQIYLSVRINHIELYDYITITI